jgi:hypothetical protein
MIRRGTVRTGKGFAIFRAIFGLFFIGLGVTQLYQPDIGHAAYLTLGIGAFLVFFAVARLLKPKGFDAKLEVEVPAAHERLAEISQLKNEGLISEFEYEAKRQEILKHL